jgi:hypothetical protein
MQIQLSEEEITAIRRINARIQGHFGGLAKHQNKKKTRERARKGAKSRMQAAAA